MGSVFQLLDNALRGLILLDLLALAFMAVMSPVPLRYNIRNVFIRWRATLATVLGIALVVAVFILLQSLAIGIEKSSARTGDPRNILVVRRGSTAESSSLINREQFKSLQYAPEIARDTAGRPMISADSLVLVNLPRKMSGEANVLIRGTSASGRELRPQVRLVAGRWFEPGRREVVVSRRLADRFANMGLGESFKTGPTVFTVVGWMDASRSAFDSEMWMDADEARAIFDREQYSSLLMRPTDAVAGTNLIARIEGDKRLQLRAIPELEYYAEQTRTATPIRWLGNFLAIAMSVGAVFAAMNTMYASVGARTREIGTLRVLGYRRRAVVASFLIEGAFLAMVGGVLGGLAALPMNGYATATISFETFSESIFEFTITPWLMFQGIVFSILVGQAGTLLPAVRASRLPVISALKSV
jgi:putative ABC transport system permease protein